MTGFVLRPGETRAFSNLDLGPIDIQVTLDDGRVVRHVAEIEGGELTRFEVPRAAPVRPVRPPQPTPIRPF